MVLPKTMIIGGSLGFTLSMTCFMIETFYQPCALGFIISLFTSTLAGGILITGLLERKDYQKNNETLILSNSVQP
jgi:hypothetical protein